MASADVEQAARAASKAAGLKTKLGSDQSGHPVFTRLWTPEDTLVAVAGTAWPARADVRAGWLSFQRRLSREGGLASLSIFARGERLRSRRPWPPR